MTDEVNEIIRVLQLTTYDEDEWDQDNVTVMRKALSAAQSLLAAACDWLADPRGRPGAVGEKAIRRICEYSGPLRGQWKQQNPFKLVCFL
jgi:vinculin